MSASSADAIRVRALGKMHRIYDRPEDRLKHMLLSSFGRRWGHEFWALREVAFEVKRGERFGVIGRNGSGKSTLLQIVAGIMAPSEGAVEVRGRVAALLELGSGFNPDFSGRENAIMNGSILGLSDADMKGRLHSIAAFADIGEFFDQPVRLYSSGMFLRLAFAVATSVDADVVLIDEALAVGDVFFQQKCYRRLEDLRARGASVLLVSHSMPDIEQFCDRAVLLDHGRVAFLGPATEAVRQYYLLEQAGRVGLTTVSTETRDVAERSPGDELASWPSPDSFLDIARVAQTSNGWARCTGVALCDASGQPRRSFGQGQTASIFSEFEMLRDVEVPIGGFNIFNSKAVAVHGRNTLQYAECAAPPRVLRGQRVRVRHDVRLDLALDEYTFEVGFGALPRQHYERRNDYSEQRLHSHLVRICHLAQAGQFIVTPPVDHTRPWAWPFYGVANLPGAGRIALAE